MDDITHAIAAGLKLSILFGCTAAIFTVAVVSVCRWLKWAPVNITVNVNDYRPGAAPDDADQVGAVPHD